MMTKTVQGSEIKVDLDNGVMINEAKVEPPTSPPTMASIHVIDKVILPPM